MLLREKRMFAYNYLYFFNFSMQLFIMETIFARMLPKKKHFLAKTILCLACYFSAGIVLTEIRRWMDNSFYHLSILYYIFLFLISLMILWILYDAPVRQLLFIGTAGYAVQHIAYCMEDPLWRILIEQEGNPVLRWILDEAVLQFLFFVIVGELGYLFFVKKNRAGFEIADMDSGMVAVSLGVLFISSVLSVIVQGYPVEMELLLIFHLYGVVSCSLGLALQFNISRKNELETENELLEQMLHTERHQQEMSRESINLINMKCHDLRHQVQALEKIDNRGMRRRAIEEINANVMIYDSSAELGNEALDLVITEKSLYCRKYNIKFSYMADGSLISFMDSADIFSLFGNAIDNAVECVVKEPEERRIISLEIRRKAGMVFVHIDNYCSTQREFENGLPVTTKGDRRMHGFGTKSIRYIAERYGGETNMYLEDGKFHLDIIFP